MKLLPLDPLSVLACALNVLLPVTVLSLIALLAARCLFRHNPSIRYSICLVGLVSVLLSPLVVGMQWQMGFALVRLPLMQSDSPLGNANATSMEPGNTVFPPYGMVWAVLSLWAVGIVWGLLRLVHGQKQITHLIEGASPWTEALPEETRERMERVLGQPIPPILTSPHISSPLALGIHHPKVILPEGLADTLAPVALGHILLHECAHVALRHTRGGVVERLVGVIFWPHPLMRPLCLELARAREEVCDNVATQEAGAACYARTLLAIAQGMLTAPNIPSVLALLGPETSLEARISGLLDPRRNHMIRLNRGKSWAVAGIAVCTLATTALVRVVAAEAKPQAEPQKAPATRELIKVEGYPITVSDQPIRVEGKPLSYAVVLSKNKATKKKAEVAAKGTIPASGRAVAHQAGKSASELHAAKLKAEAEAQATEASAKTQGQPKPK